MSAVRPNRSDVHVALDEQRKIEEVTRDHFDSIAPKRHTKPQRSEQSLDYSDASNSDADSINPELVKFQQLENEEAQKLVYNGTEAIEDYMETDYYKDLNGVDKQHHTTGTGFIEVEKVSSNPFKLRADSATNCQPSSKGNPATNDWIPSDTETMISSSNKPSRSEDK